MASFRENLLHCRELSAFLDGHCARKAEICDAAQERECSENSAYAAGQSAYSTEYDQLTNEIIHKRNLRVSAAQQALTAADRILKSIRDPHWFRMRQHYYDATQELADPSRYRASDTERMITELDTVCADLRKQVRWLRDAFVPPDISGVVGYVIRPFRKTAYTRIASLRNKLMGIAIALADVSDLEAEQARVDRAMAAAQENLGRRHALALQQIRQSAAEQLAQLMEHDSALLRTSEAHNTLRSPLPLKIGQYTYPDDAHSASEEEADRSGTAPEPLYTMGVTCSGFDRSVLFYGPSSLTGFYRELVLDILSDDPGARIAMLDIVGLGRHYSDLAGLSGASGFRVLSTADQVQSYLESAECSISEAYAGREQPGKSYIFIDDCIRNVPERCVDSLARIMTNGSACGVYVIASVRDGESLDRRWNSLLADVGADRFCVSDNRLLIGPGYIDLASADQLESRVGRLISDLEQISASADVLPIWKTFPEGERWQNCSSENGICVPFGIHVQTGAPAYFKLTEEKPYALIVGDVDVGKSSALHCLALQIMARYAPSEVKIAVGDFKDGCEFNTYVRNGVAAVEAVVNSQDCDAMSSFLGFYVAEMGRRQGIFNAVSEQCGSLVRKYETYREVCSSHGLPYVPRICLIIDEFQSLFDSPAAGTASLLSELVRKGRTYGIHLVMASQRAVSDNPRNGFTSELKNYFSTRMVFRCPQQAARSMLAERCADTGRENPGIPGAALLKKGHCILNTYMGQNERDNSTIQCFYASDSAIEKAVRALRMLNGVSGHAALISQDAPSRAVPGRVEGFVLLGDSMRLKYDDSCPNEDVFRDNAVVGIDLRRLRSNIVAASGDMRVHAALLRATVDAAPEGAILNLCGPRSSPLVELFLRESDDGVNYAEHITDLPCEPADAYTINLIVDPERVPENTQANTLRRTAAVEHFDRLLDLPEGGNVMNVLFTSNFRLFKTNLPYAAAKVPLRIVGIGDSENLRLAVGENTVMARTGFDTLSQNAIKAYYHNKTSGKTGKVTMFTHTK